VGAFSHQPLFVLMKNFSSNPQECSHLLSLFF